MNLDIINIRQKKINFLFRARAEIDFFDSLLGLGQYEKIFTDIAFIRNIKSIIMLNKLRMILKNKIKNLSFSIYAW